MSSLRAPRSLEHAEFHWSDPCLRVGGVRAAAAQSGWSPAALDELEALAASAPLEGLPEERAALEELARFRHLADTDPAADAQTDIAADALFFSLARSFAQGGADPARADPDWADPAFGCSRPRRPPIGARSRRAAVSALASAAACIANTNYCGTKLARLRSVDSPAARIVSLRASLERWRWLPRAFAERRLEVRIPQYELRFITPGEASAVHKVIVGARDSQTPSFTAEIASITFNPSWEPPASIAAELLRRFRRDPDAAAREGLRP